MIKVMVVDDHSLMRAGIAEMLKNSPNIRVIGQSRSGEEALKMAKEENPDVVLMDIKMPGMGGLEATTRLLKQNPDIKILIVTVCDDDLLPSRLLQAGAVGYLTKGATMKEMIQAIRAVYHGQRYISPGIARQLALNHVSGASADQLFDSLSEREVQVMLMLVRGISVQAISDALHLSAKTISSYRYRIFEKLQVNNDVELTLLVLRYGILDTDDLRLDRNKAMTEQEGMNSEEDDTD